ncbi:glycosyltransferase [Paraburkholderia phenoliruptrix]|uniref:Glycosyltransferase n=1 Tax=Paraburkholderia phenoliruptrix TaxID=252970 RepID=A0ABV3W5T2_9BURK|nr:glycosyltransferase [Paraburkholderia phenoliruptrix]MDR6390352.1 glycosyltransferase involved in cell wall biosynthesis [Paraburkholderia phenoliruptrix]
MKIVHVVETWIGGVANYVRALMVEQRNMGHEIVLLCDPRNLKLADIGVTGISVVHYRSSRNPLLIPAIAHRLKRVLVGLQADVIHCHSTFPGLYVRLNRFRDEKILYTPHAWSFMKRDIAPVTRHAFAFVERAMANRCTRILCMSFDEVRAAKRHGIGLDNIDLVYTGIAPDSASERLIETAALTLNPVTTIHIGYFGRLDYQKGFDILLNAIPLLREGLHVHVFGAAVRGGVNVQSDDPRVTYHGWVGPDETRRAMLDMDVIVVPSRWEGLALVPIEAMRAGKVLVVSSEGSLPEQVIHGYNGLMLRELSGTCLADQLNALSIEECRRMGANARHVFDHAFRADRFFKSLMSCYENA